MWRQVQWHTIIDFSEKPRASIFRIGSPLRSHHHENLKSDKFFTSPSAPATMPQQSGRDPKICGRTV